MIPASPIRISVELEGIEPNDRLRAACDELASAAAELIEETTEVEGFSHLHSDDVAVKPAWTDMRPGVMGFDIGMAPTRSVTSKVDDAAFTDRL